MSVNPEYIDAVAQQDKAADPTRDVFVSANAGSGKTHVLVNRVSRILLSGGGVAPEKILCLTYTKAAASEMQTRLFKRLGKWSIMDADTLRGELDSLLGPEESARVELSRARRLFTKALETPEGLKVQTIHAFCERILSRFPVEAGILPGFGAMDDEDARGLQEDVWDDILRTSHAGDAPELTEALRMIMASTANKTLDGLRKWMGYNYYKITQWQAVGGITPLANRLGIKVDDTAEEIKAAAWQAIDKDELKAAIYGLRESKSKTQIKLADGFEAALKMADPVEAYDAYAALVLKKDNTPKTNIGISDSGVAAYAFFGEPKCADTPQMCAVECVVAKVQGVKILTATRAVYTLACAFAARYQAAKRARRLLDFNDQIMLTRGLLKDSHVSDWVRYKLDGGIEHILVDEAQDTSQAQWDIVDVVRAMFTQDQDRDPRYPRTMFAVGDEKQSIYSFQGADPELFISRTKEEAEGSAYSGIRMRMSFRSAPDILKFVDEVFVRRGGMQDMFDADYVPPAADLITHTAKRTVAGYVELWPLSPAPPKDQIEIPWKPEPIDAQAADSAPEALARAIAQRIKYWLDNKSLVTIRDDQVERTRPMQAKDILILVRTRSGPFFNAIIRNLKWAGVAVAGADRLILSESIAVKDLMSLARFTCLPEDDLALAEVLTGPLFGIDDEQLFDLSCNRLSDGPRARLWPALKTMDEPWARAAVVRLELMIGLSRKHAPYEFFEGVLSTVVANGTSQLRRFYTRLSMEVADPVQAFLARALAHQRRGAPSLQHFIQSFAQDEQALKRELDGSHNEVRVMTVYGAKGLEAPVVILPDTSKKPGKTGVVDNEMLTLGDGTFARVGSEKESPKALVAIREARLEKIKQEYMRLFYVALTRAETRLLICGYFAGNRPKEGAAQKAVEGCWHRLAQDAVMAMGGEEIETPFTSDEFKGYAYGSLPIRGDAEIETIVDAPSTLPKWAAQAIPPPDVAPKLNRYSPSTLLSGDAHMDLPNVAPGLMAQKGERFERGIIIHKLLELLPDVAVDKRERAARRFLSGYRQSEDARAEIINTVMTVLNHADFAEIFAPGSLAEISLAGHAPGLPEGVRLNAQIDRLSVTKDKVFIVDYKSNRPPPARAQDVAELYLGQMVAYREMAKAAFPKRDIICALLWTEGPDLMILPDGLLDQALVKIRERLS